MKKILLGLVCLLSFEMHAFGAEKEHTIAIEININCPTSEAFNEFMKSIPSAGNYSSNYDEWKSSFINNMTQLIHLVESEQISNSSWSVKVDEPSK